jgi:hypothetical protein
LQRDAKMFRAFVMKRSSKIFAVALIATAPWFVAAAPAAPISQSMGLQNAVAPSVETVQYCFDGVRHSCPATTEAD